MNTNSDLTTAPPRVTPTRPTPTAIAVNAALVVVLTILIASVAYRTRLLTTNIDGLSMMSIARQYAHGEFANAVNGYWSPLVSWLMAPFIAVGAGLTTSYMIVTTLTCVAILVLGAWLVLRATGSVWLGLWFTAATGSLLLANVTRQTPDLLVVLWFLLFVWALVVADRAWDGSVRRMVFAGVALGAACWFGYVAKLYTVPVFLLVVAIWLALRWARRGAPRRRRQLLLPGVALASLVLLSAPWVIALSVKYDGFMLGSSFGVNISGKFADAADPTDGDYLVPVPPNDTAVTPAEDRTPAMYAGNALTAPRTNGTEVDNESADADPAADAAATDAASGSGLAAKARYYITQRIDAFPFYLNRIGSLGAYAAPIGVLFAAAAVAGVIRFRTHPAAVLTAIATGVYALGYAFITTEASQGGNARYYLPVPVGALLLGVTLVPMVWRRIGAGAWIRKTLVVLACVVVAVASFTQNVIGEPHPFSIVKSGAGGASWLDVFGPTAVPDNAAFVAALRSTDAIPAGSKIIGDNARETVSIAWWTGAQAYGKSEQQYDFQDPSLIALLRDAGVDQFLHFAQPGTPEPDYSAIGTLRVSIDTESSCDNDLNGGTPIPCRIDVVDIRR